MTIYIGVDYSMTSPAVCIYKGGEITDPNNFEFHYLTSTKKYEGSFENGFITGWHYPDYSTPEERFDKISDWVLMLMTNAGGHEYGLNEEFVVTIEGYSMGSKGKVFHIAENTGLLKFKLWQNGIVFDTPAPTTVKKFATSKGNSNKEAMYESFLAKTGWDIESLLGGDRKSNPVSDIVDSWFMCMYGVQNTLVCRN